MKKALSFILAFAMILTCIPMAFAATPTADEQAFLYECARHQSSYASFYNIDGEYIGGKHLIDYGYQDIYEEMADSEWYEEMISYSSEGNWIKDNPGKLADATASLKAVNDKWDAHILENGYIRVVNTIEMYEFVLRLEFFYDEEIQEEFYDFLGKYISDDVFEKLEEEDAKIESFVQKAEADITSVTQEEFDEAIKDYIAIGYQIIDCFEGYHVTGECTDLDDGTHSSDCTFCKTTGIIEEHSFGEYISDSNATTANDGTKTAKCDKCTATDTVTDEGSKLDSEEDSFSSVFDFIRNLFSKIFDFIKKLFG